MDVDGGSAVAPAHEGAYATVGIVEVNGVYNATVIYTADEGDDRTLGIADDAASEAGDGEASAHFAVLDGVTAAPGVAHKATGVAVSRFDITHYTEVLDGGVAYVVERGGAIRILIDVH